MPPRKKRTLIVGDIHGAHIPLQQCLDRCAFDYENDELITLGDICDGWPYVYECVEILKRIRGINIIGNHDEWFRYWLETGYHSDNWLQGGKGTLRSYLRLTDREHMIERSLNYNGFITALRPEDIPQDHIEFFRNQINYYKDTKKRLFIHGGFYRLQTLESIARRYPHVFWWDRELWYQALCVSKGARLKFVEDFSEIFIGHTTTLQWTHYKKAADKYILMPNQSNDCPPMKADIIYNLDTGAGTSGRLTIMDVDTHEYWQSDPVNEIYGDFNPRG